MKTLKNSKTGELKRINEKDADKLVRQEYLGWEYVPKEVWKMESKNKSNVNKNEKESVKSRAGKKTDGKTKKSGSL